MSVGFQVTGLQRDKFTYLFSLSELELQRMHAKILIVDKSPGFPCRISLMDAEIGERVIAIPFVHHEVNSPYRASGPIFIRENAINAQLQLNEIPEMLLRRVLSVRAYTENAMLIAADVVEGAKLRECINNFFSNPDIDYLHIHNAKPGCYNCSIMRAPLQN